MRTKASVKKNNHPSIFVWSLFNEIGNDSEDPHQVLQELQAVARGEDPTRPTIAATQIDARPQMNKIPDLLGWNMYPGWYSRTKEDCGPITEHTNTVTDVKIYSNAKEPELFLNGISQGKCTNGVNSVFIWKNIMLFPGENKIAARAEAAGRPLSDECIWKLSAPR